MVIKSLHHKKYKRFDIKCYKDPVRNILVQATPEEAVRQDVICTLVDTYGYALSNLNTEYIIPNTRIRADIVVWVPTKEHDENGNMIEKPIIVIECKSRDVYLTQEHFEQGADYCDKLGAKYLAITNGDESWIYERRKQDDYLLIEDIPKYKDLKRNKWFPKSIEDDEDYKPRPMYNMLYDEGWLKNSYEEIYGDWIIGVDTPQNLWPLLIDLQHLLWEVDPFFTSPIKWKGYKFIEDLGVSWHSFGNAAGGSFYGAYRSLLVQDKQENNHIIRFGLLATAKLQNDPVFGNSKGITYFNVAVCNGESMHNSLQINMDMSIKKIGEKYHVTHSGQMTVGNLGRVKNKLVLDYLFKHEPSLIMEGSIHLGMINHTKLLEWADVKELLLNMAVYALLRDDLRSDYRYKQKAKKTIKKALKKG